MASYGVWHWSYEEYTLACTSHTAIPCHLGDIIGIDLDWTLRVANVEVASTMEFGTHTLGWHCQFAGSAESINKREWIAILSNIREL